MKDHPDSQEIALWVLDRTSAKRSTRTHMEAACDSCSGLAASFHQLLEETRVAVRSEPPPNLLARARGLVDALPQPYLLARLVQDSFSLAGVRDETTEARYLLFDAGDYELDVRLRAVGEGHRTEVRGQLHGPEDTGLEGFEVRLVREDALLTSGSIDELGEFLLRKTPPPPFHLEFHRGPLRIRTPEISR